MAKDLARIISKIREAGQAPEAWPEAFKSLTDVLGVEGAACIILNKHTKRADWAFFSGLGAAFESKYIEHYASLDPFSPLLHVLPGWTKLSECLPKSALQKSEWYNDFVLAAGIRDIMGARLTDTPSHSVVFGLHRRIGRSFESKTAPILGAVTGALSSEMHRRVEHLFGAPAGEPVTKTAATGTRYYFHISNGKEYPDQTGAVFANDAEAVAYASGLAAELEQDRGWTGFVVRILDEDGKLLARIPIG